jgi:hypothetical protein
LNLDIEQLVVDGREAMESSGVAYAVIGGCARNAYAEPRATKDIDFVAAGDARSFAAVEAALAARGFQRASVVEAPGESVPDLVLYCDAHRRRIDVLFAKTDFERSALARREAREPYGSVALPIVSPEDLVVYKLIAGRTQDWADIEHVLAALAVEGRAVDWPYIERWCAEWEIPERAARARGLQP